MKLRCTDNSIRLRLRKSDIDSLRQNASVSEKVNLGDQIAFSFELKIEDNLDSLSVSFLQNTLSISLPFIQAKNWIESQQVGIEVFQSLEGEEKLHILIEKDFPCLDRENENKADTFWELAKDQPEAC